MSSREVQNQIPNKDSASSGVFNIIDCWEEYKTTFHKILQQKTKKKKAYENNTNKYNKIGDHKSLINY